MEKNLFVIIVKNFFLLFLKLRCNVVVLLESYYDIFNVYFYLWENDYENKVKRVYLRCLYKEGWILEVMKKRYK